MKDKSMPRTDSRRKILDAATDEFAAGGLTGARVDRIALKAGVNKAMIYYHYSSKEHLYQTMIAGQVEKIAAVLGDVVDPESDLDSSLLELSKMYHKVLGSDERLASVLRHEFAAGGEVLLAALRNSIFRRNLPRRLKKRLDEGRRSGKLRNVDARHALISFFGMNLFYILMAPIANTMWEIKDAKKFRQKRPAQIVDLFLNGLKAR
jgi:AcrR family transcriptional regulator